MLLMTSAVCVAGIALVAGLVGGLPVENVLAGLGVLVLTVSGLLGIGFFFAGVTIKLKESAQLLVSGLQFFFFIFSAQFFPFSVLPAPVRDYVSRWLPVSYAVDLFRTTLLGVPPELLPNDVALEYLIVIGFAIVSPILGYLGYRAIEDRARKAGTLGEY